MKLDQTITSQQRMSANQIDFRNLSATAAVLTGDYIKATDAYLRLRTRLVDQAVPGDPNDNQVLVARITECKRLDDKYFRNENGDIRASRILTFMDDFKGYLSKIFTKQEIEEIKASLEAWKKNEEQEDKSKPLCLSCDG